MQSLNANRSRTASAIASLLLAPLLAAYQDGPPYRIGGGVSAPVPIHTAEPAYTQEAREAKIQGAVVLTVVIDEAGVATEIRVAKSLDPGLDTQAIEAMKLWRFKPGMKDDKPVPVQATIEVQFKLL